MSHRDRAALGLTLLLLAVPFLRTAERQAVPAWAEGPQGETSAVGQLLFGGVLDPNRASEEDLTVLPGIGPVRAAAIVAQRDRRTFCRAGDLEQVHGLGPGSVARLRGWIGFTSPPEACRSALD